MAQKITDRLVKELRPPVCGNRVTYDTELKGFGIRLTAAGAKAFVLNYRIAGRERRITIGSYPDWSVAAAREAARRLKRYVDLGADPMGERHEQRAAPTMADLAARYIEEHLPRKRPSSQRDDRGMLARDILPAFARYKVAQINHADVDALHRAITKRASHRANRVVALLSKMFSLAIKWGWRSDNPARGVERNPEERRHRYLSPDELVRLSAALREHRNLAAGNAIRLLLLTGARRYEVLSAKWNEIDLEAGVWVKPSAHTKQKREHRIPLSAPARQLLAEMSRDASSEFLFPNGKDGHLTDLKRTWTAVRRTADIMDCRLHDLRHTYASLLASSGQSLPIIGALLGHTQPQTTSRYAHLMDDPLREATERVGALLSRSPSVDDAVVVPLDRRDGGPART